MARLTDGGGAPIKRSQSPNIVALRKRRRLRKISTMSMKPPKKVEEDSSSIESADEEDLTIDDYTPAVMDRQLLYDEESSSTEPDRICFTDDDEDYGHHPLLHQHFESVNQPSTLEPMAPMRHSNASSFLSAMLSADVPRFLRAVSKGCVDVDAEVFAEWVLWDASQLEVVSSEYTWISPILLAARWASPAIMLALLGYVSGVSLSARTLFGENALIALCAQPPPSHKTSLAMRGHYSTGSLSFPKCGEDLFLENADEMGVECLDLIETEDALFSLRRREMALVAKQLLDVGVDPLCPDCFGRTAVDYARLYGHEEIIVEIENVLSEGRKVRGPLLFRTSSIEESTTMIVVSSSPPGTPRMPSRYQSETTNDDTMCRTPSPRRSIGDATPAAQTTTNGLLLMSGASTLPTACCVEEVASLCRQRKRGRRLTPNDRRLIF